MHWPVQRPLNACAKLQRQLRDAQIQEGARDPTLAPKMAGRLPSQSRSLLGRLGEEAVTRRRIIDSMSQEEQKKNDESTWYHEGPDTLRTAREWIADYSVPRAKERIKRLRAEHAQPDKTKMAVKQEVQKKVKALDVQASQIVDTRPVSFCQFSPDSKMLATASWSGVCKLWSVPDCKEVQSHVKS